MFAGFEDKSCLITWTYTLFSENGPPVSCLPSGFSSLDSCHFHGHSSHDPKVETQLPQGLRSEVRLSDKCTCVTRSCWALSPIHTSLYISLPAQHSPFPSLLLHAPKLSFFSRKLSNICNLFSVVFL